MHLLRLLILSLPLLTTVLAATVDEAKAALAKLPGLAKAAGQVLSSDGGAFTTQVATPAGPVGVSVIRTAKGEWLAVVQPPAGAGVCPAPVREALGDSKLTPLALIVSGAELQLDPGLLPKPLRKTLGVVQLKAGGNLFLASPSAAAGCWPR